MSRNEMFCRLDETHETSGGDYIPKGTPVRVLGWSTEAEGLIRVEPTVHMYSDRCYSDEFRSFIGTGLLIDVKPSVLTFSSCDTGE